MNHQHLLIHQHEVHAIPLLCIHTISSQDSNQTYYVNFPMQADRISCPVPNCPYSATTRNRLRQHFSHLHDSDIIIILQEGKLPHCPYCQMFVSNVGPKHFATQACQTQAAQFVERDRLARQAIQATKSIFYRVITSGGFSVH
jgi:hypothetical protein